MKSKNKPIEISMIGIPPVKSPSIGSHDDNKKRRTKLEDECFRIASDKKLALSLYKKRVKLTISYARFRGKLDAANIIGGIADALQGYFYKDDGQIREVVYKESTAKKKDKYTIILDEAPAA